MSGYQDLQDRQVWRERISQLEAQVERLKGALVAGGWSERSVDRIALGMNANWVTAVPETTVDL